MKNTAMILFVLLGAFLSGTLSATEKSSVVFGKKLFNDTHLGGSVNTKSCNTCHAAGRGLQHSGKRADLAEVINFCIVNPLEGKKITKSSPEMHSLILYIQSLK